MIYLTSINHNYRRFRRMFPFETIQEGCRAVHKDHWKVPEQNAFHRHSFPVQSGWEGLRVEQLNALHFFCPTEERR